MILLLQKVQEFVASSFIELPAKCRWSSILFAMGSHFTINHFSFKERGQISVTVLGTCKLVLTAKSSCGKLCKVWWTTIPLDSKNFERGSNSPEVKRVRVKWEQHKIWSFNKSLQSEKSNPPTCNSCRNKITIWSLLFLKARKTIFTCGSTWFSGCDVNPAQFTLICCF